MDLQKRIERLPQVIQDLIGEYNVEHRDIYRKLEKELFSIKRQACPCCKTLYTEWYWYSIEYFICKKNRINMFWCDSECFENDPDLETKKKTAKLIDDYLKQSIQYNRDS